VRRKALLLLCAVLFGLATAVAVRLVAADGSSAPAEAAQAFGKLGAVEATAPFSAKELEQRLAAKGIEPGSPVFIRIFKKEAELELWMEVGKRFELFATYPICNWSGTLGPKLTEGDKQSPEGLYVIGGRQLRQSARWRRSLDLGFPNTFDRALRRTGSDLLIHGGCTSEGCYAMTDPVIDEIFWLSDTAIEEGQRRIQVHAFPFRMTVENMTAHTNSEWHGFWSNLKEAYDLFERTRRPPAVSVCDNRYVVGETAKDDDDCAANISATEAWAAQRARAAAARRVRARNAMRAYAAARRARLAARAKQRQALHSASQNASQRKLAK
jgi:murein L,D-transpeptidase YafK